MNCLFDLAGVVIRVTINKLNFVLEWLVSGVVGMLWNGAGLGTGESDVSIMLLNSKDRNAPIRAVKKTKKNNYSQQSIMLYKITHDQVDLIAWRRLGVCSRNVKIYITRDYIVRQTKNLYFIVIVVD